MWWDYIKDFIKTFIHISDLASQVRDLERQIIELRAQLAAGDFPAKISGLETEVIKLRIEMGALAKRVDKLEEVTGNINRHINPPDKAEPLPKHLHAKNLLWFENDKTPYCPKCFAKDTKRMPMQRIETSIRTTSMENKATKSLRCSICGYETSPAKPPKFPISNPP